MKGVFEKATSFDQDLSAWDIADVTRMSGVLDESGLSPLNYTETLVGWSAKMTRSNVAFGAKDLTYVCIASGARAALVARGWTIADAGPAPGECFDSRWKTDNPGTSTDTQIALPSPHPGRCGCHPTGETTRFRSRGPESPAPRTSASGCPNASDSVGSPC